MSQSLSKAAAARLDAFHALLDYDPQDWLIRSLLADWYADQGDSMAEDCLRWQAREQKRPLNGGYGLRWRWYDMAEYQGRHDYLASQTRSSCTPHAVQQRRTSWPPGGRHSNRVSGLRRHHEPDSYRSGSLPPGG
jgi:hypothetical protein